MQGSTALRQKSVLRSVGVLILTLIVLSGCGGSNTTTSSSNQPQSPIKIGISLSLSGDFSADGKAFQQGYQLWADTVNKNGGLLGREGQFDILSDARRKKQGVTNYLKMSPVVHWRVVFWPLFTLLREQA